MMKLLFYFADERALYARIDMEPCVMQEWMRLDVKSKICLQFVSEAV